MLIYYSIENMKGDDYLNNLLEAEKIFFIEEDDGASSDERDKDKEERKKYEALKKKAKYDLSYDTVKVIKNNDKEMDEIIKNMRLYGVSENSGIDKKLFKKFNKNKNLEV